MSEEETTLDTSVGTPIGQTGMTCYNPECMNLVTRDGATLYAFGVSHYHKDKGKSYLQIHDSIHACSDECGIMAAHKRIEDTKAFNHGEFHQNLHPNGEFTDDLVKGCVEYHANPMAWSTMPKRCALFSCGKDLTDANELYIPHVDAKGNCYQAVLQALDNGEQGGLDAYNLGACSLDHAYQVAHGIVDFIHADDKHDRSDSYVQPTVQVPVVRSRGKV